MCPGVLGISLRVKGYSEVILSIAKWESLRSEKYEGTTTRILSWLLLFVPALGTTAAQAAHRDDPQQLAPFTIEISAQQNTYVGTPLQLLVKLTKTSKKSIVVWQDMTKKAEFFYTIMLVTLGTMSWIIWMSNLARLSCSVTFFFLARP
jgi:hypothetical protein